MHKLVLKTELVPKTAWYSNLRSILTPTNWKKLSKAVRERSQGSCPICGLETPIDKLDAHETWAYNDFTHEQLLDKVEGICWDCHRVKHIGKASVDGRFEEALEWHSIVNDISIEESDEIITQDFDVWKERSQHNWKLLIDPNIFLEYMPREWVMEQLERLEQKGVLLK